MQFVQLREREKVALVKFPQNRGSEWKKFSHEQTRFKANDFFLALDPRTPVDLIDVQIEIAQVEKKECKSKLLEKENHIDQSPSIIL